MAVPAPASITVGDVIRGEDVTISWSAVPGAISYTVERSLNGAPFGNVPQDDVFSTGGTSATFTVGEDWNTVQYRVKALVQVGNTPEFSDWTTSEIKTVGAVSPPIPGTGAWKSPEVGSRN